MTKNVSLANAAGLIGKGIIEPLLKAGFDIQGLICNNVGKAG
jgi:hypothetical protein